MVLGVEGSVEVWASAFACASRAWRFRRASRRRRAREGGTLSGGGIVGIVDELEGVMVERGFEVDVGDRSWSIVSCWCSERSW